MILTGLIAFGVGFILGYCVGYVVMAATFKFTK